MYVNLEEVQLRSLFSSEKSQYDRKCSIMRQALRLSTFRPATSISDTFVDARQPTKQTTTQ